MSKAKITLIGLESYLSKAGDSLFSDLILPAGINKDDCINNILMRANEFELLYSDPVFLKANITLWGRTWYKVFERWLQTLEEEYNPIHNYDRTEEISEKVKEDNKSSMTGSGTNNSKGNSKSKTETDNTTTGLKAAYNSSTFENNDQDVLDGETNYSDENNIQGSSTTKNDGSENKDLNRDYKARMFGNIGVTTSAAMLTEEILTREKFNLYKMIADVFVKEFCIMIY